MEDIAAPTIAEVNNLLTALTDTNAPINSDILFEKAKKLAETNSMLVGVAGNAISLFALFILKEILEQQALNPTANINNIINIATAISTLNSTLTVYSLARP